MSNKTITFKPEFETKLKKLRIKTKFVNNLKHAAGMLQENYSTLRERIREADSYNSWHAFINVMAT